MIFRRFSLVAIFLVACQEKIFQEVLLNLKIISYHPVILLVSPYESVLDLVSFIVPLGAHGVRTASHAWVFIFPARLAPGSWLVFYQPFLYQPITRILKGVQIMHFDATLEKATLFPTVFSKTGLLL